MFKHSELKLDYELEATTTDKGRRYKTPEGLELPSVTTVLGFRGKAAIRWLFRRTSTPPR